ncbi:electron transport complex subunit RsxG [Marinobacterium sp. LSUCC0821]|uniref:electron transport complex subunit RsxG n=1 Tax=Marinobacterium sp. LSUCC0821 TaxID=2668067 RepID=UPI0014521A6D|nr:electron transport complex subunit RsxG [Marinobacterium sp. LSUCC0821]QJD71128.1 electron transport complex subunit RsxG [Marinobacterium sp. LSUCC0821]
MSEEQQNQEISFGGSIGKSMLGIGMFAILAAGIIAVTQVSTKDQIAENIRAAQSRALFEIFPADIDPHLFDHTVELAADELNLEEEAVNGYQVIDGETVKGVILPVRSEEGYSGNIDLMVGINADSSIAGVRIISHKETPGLGDKIDRAKSLWVDSFIGKIRQGSDDSRWAVKKDGGQFDQFTGATITPRAVVGAIGTAITYFENHRIELLQAKEQSQ